MFTVLDQVSLPGFQDYPNEDACGVAGDWAWVIDTSIFPGTPAILHDKSDAAWFAAFANARFLALAPSAEDGRALVRQVMVDARETFLKAAPPERHDPVTWPLGAMTLVHDRGDRLCVWTFGDTTAYVRRPDGTVLTVGEGPNLREWEAAKARELLQLSGSTPATITKAPAFRSWLAERREGQKQTGGAAILSLRPEAADRLRYDELESAVGAVVLLTSDGLSAIVDLYRSLDAAGLVEIALRSGLEPLAREARRIETEVDPAGRLYPRFKTSDDATGLLLRVG
jgi:hypothetical protein